MVNTICATKFDRNTDTIFSEGPAWFLEHQRISALNRQREPFDVAGWLLLVQQSTLHPADKATALDIAADANLQGISHISRTDLAMEAGVTRVATITARLKRLREAGFLDSTQRFNQTSQHRLMMGFV